MDWIGLELDWLFGTRGRRALALPLPAGKLRE